MENYSCEIEGASHWSLMVRRGVELTLRDIHGGANVGMLMYNPNTLSEKYNAPDTLKCQHTFKLTRGNCLYSDMGRIFCSITEDDFGWHDSVCGNSHASHVNARWGKRDYQKQSNAWLQNGYDSFLVELAKYDLDRCAMAMNVNWFSQVSADADGNLALSRKSTAGESVSLRFEMDTLVILHTCPHPLNDASEYPMAGVELSLKKAEPVKPDDYCMNYRPENSRGFANNALYHFGQ
ncbi:MAG: urea carboxylase-associated protein 2 [Flavobacteriales bacterium]|jgi:urea carboxylase-associated protein 2